MRQLDAYLMLPTGFKLNLDQINVPLGIGSDDRKTKLGSFGVFGLAIFPGECLLRTGNASDSATGVVFHDPIF